MRILHLYPNLMNLYGDYGNVRVLVKYLNDLGIETQLDEKELGDNYNLKEYDFIYMGSGTESKQLFALNDLLQHKDELVEYINENKVVLLTGDAMELLGEKIDDNKGLGIINFTVKTSDKRYTGDVILHNEKLGDVVGFINKSSLISGGEEYKLFNYDFKDNNLIDNDYEGYHYNNLFGTHVIGPLLVKNPCFLDYLVELLAKDKYRKIEYEYLDKAYNVTLEELRKRK